MKVNHYSFGRIIIDGKIYTSDVIIYPDRVDPSWWRKEGHHLNAADLTDVINAMPDVIVIGTGYSGMMAVPEETVKFIRSKGIDVHVARTERAIEIFNSLPDDKKPVAALHLTC
ncbi:MAG: Mth938-like domain-containing protein [Thermodesulfovibrionales bacterium]